MSLFEMRKHSNRRSNTAAWIIAATLICTGVMDNPGTARSIPVDAATTDVSHAVTVRPDNIEETTASNRTVGFSAHPLSTTARATTAPPAVAFDPAIHMSVEEIRPGMKGYGLTVFAGLEPEKFEVEVIGTRHRMMAGTDIILCRLHSPHLVNLGVVAGMSGSPVYVEGRLIGAVAYGFLDVDDPLAGVTPIGDMLNVYNATPVVPAERADEASSSAGLDVFEAYMAMRDEPTLENLQNVALVAAPGRPLNFKATDFGPGAADRFNLPDSFTLQPLSAPVVLGAQSSLTSALARTVFPALDIQVPGNPAIPASSGGIAPHTYISEGATSSGVPSTHAANTPGGPVPDLHAFASNLTGGHALAVPFIEGDLNMAVVGTVTWRHADRLVAFGHPMTQRGTSYFPMAAARINAIVRSRTRPFKLGEPVGHIGMIRQDRVPAVGGLFGQTAPMFEMTAVVQDPGYVGRREFNYRIWNDRTMAPGLVLSALGESISSAARTDGESAAIYTYSIQMDDGTSITTENYISDTNGSMMGIIQAMADVGTLMNNPFKPVGVDQLKFEVQLTDRLRQARLESATLDKPTYRPGEIASIEWVLRPFRQDPLRLSYSFPVPANLPDGNYTIAVMDAGARADAETKRNPGGRKLNDYEDVVRLIQRNFPENRIFIAMVDQDTGVTVSGKEMPRLPGSIINSIQETVDSGYFAPVRGNFVIDADLPTTYEVSGEARATLTVSRR